MFDISEHYGFFLASLLLWGLIVPFSDRLKEKIYQSRTKILIGANVFLLLGFALLFLLPAFAQALFAGVNFFIGLTTVNFFLLLLILLTRKDDSFFNSSFSKVLAVLTAANLVPFFYQEWNSVWWYYHLLWLVSLLLLLLLRAKKGGDITEILFSSFSIRARLFFIVGLTLAAIVVNGLIDFRLSQNHLQTQTLENLALMADIQEGQVLNYLDKLKDRTVDFSSDGFIRDGLEKILSGDRQAVIDLSRHLLENKQPLDPMIFGIHIMDPSGKVVASSQLSEIGAEDMAVEEVFIQARGSRYANAYLSDITEDVHFREKNITIMATAPIIERAKLENAGVIMLFFKTQELSDILTGKAQTQSGALSTWTSRTKTMEMYLVNRDKVMVTESRFILNASLKQKVDTEPVRLCAKSEEVSGEYLDYRDIPVFGASMCFSNGWTLLVEIDRSEALATLGDYLQQNLLSASVTLLLILLMMYLFILGITSPLQELSQVAQKISAGDFSARVKLLTRDEFGELSRVFNQMVENIQKGSADLQQKVKEEESSRLAMTNILGDLEEEKLRAESLTRDLEKFKLAVDNASDHIVITDPEGIILFANAVAEKMSGFSVKEMMGKKVGTKELWGGKMGKPFYDRLWKTVKQEKKIFVGVIQNHKKDGTKYLVAASIIPLLDTQGNVAFFVAIERDITYEHEVDRAKTEFVSLASHQLRTPLTSINWYIEMLQSGDAGALNDKQKEFLAEVYTGCQRMVQLVSDLLNVSRLETGRLKIEPVPIDLAAFIGEVRSELEPQIQEKGCQVSLEFPKEKIAKVNADKVLLRQVISNLLTNAIRYSSGAKKGQIIISVAVSPQAYTIGVEDNGIGIPKEVQ